MNIRLASVPILARRSYKLLGVVVFAVFLGALGGGSLAHLLRTVPVLAAVDVVDKQEGGLGQQLLITPTVYLPFVASNADPGWVAPWGIQTHNYTLSAQAAQAGAKWVRVDARWDVLEPTNNNYDWGSLDNALQQLVAVGLTPMIDVVVNPTWADDDGNKCGPLTNNQYLADFLTDMVNRYNGGVYDYDVKYWEIGNEVDHTYDIAQILYPSGIIGCWGDLVPEYVSFLRTAHDAIKASDPAAQVLLGGLTLIGPTDPQLQALLRGLALESSDPINFDFLNDVLNAGGGAYFDIVPFHFGNSQDLASYTCVTSDLDGRPVCGVRGKATLVRTTLAAHSLDKPIMLNEVGSWCEPCDATNQQVQARNLARDYVWGLVEGLQSVVWYKLDYPGFHGSSLLWADGSPKPAYSAYSTLTSELHKARYYRTVDGQAEFGVSDLEGYVFRQLAEEKMVFWATGSVIRQLRFPSASLPMGQLRVVNIYGAARILTDNNDDGVAGDGFVTVDVGQAPIYIQAQP